MRVARVVIVLAAIAATLTACTPGRKPLLAIGLVDGLPVAFVHSCVNGAAELNVTENTQAPTTTPPTQSATPTSTPTPTVTNTITPETETYVYSWVVKHDDAPALIEVPLFTVPDGWRVEKDTLNALQKGSRYIADAKLTGVFDVSPVNFTMDELLELEEGQVLYGINAPLTTVLTRAEFDEKAQESCASTEPSTTA